MDQLGKFERPPKSNSRKQLQTNNVFTNDMKDLNSTNKSKTMLNTKIPSFASPGSIYSIYRRTIK